MNNLTLDLVWIIAEYHRDRIQPSIAYDVRDLAQEYDVKPKDILNAINYLLAERESGYANASEELLRHTGANLKRPAARYIGRKVPKGSK